MRHNPAAGNRDGSHLRAALPQALPPTHRPLRRVVKVSIEFYHGLKLCPWAIRLTCGSTHAKMPWQTTLRDRMAMMGEQGE
jgi:hypothetical protein